jgi:hypothetical protein
MVHVVIQAAAGNAELPSGYLFTSRDKAAAASGLMFGRATRALANDVENLTPFVLWRSRSSSPTARRRPRGDHLDPGAHRVHPALLFDVVYGRTAICGLSIVGLVMMLTRLIGF